MRRPRALYDAGVITKSVSKSKEANSMQRLRVSNEMYLAVTTHSIVVEWPGVQGTRDGLHTVE